MINEFCDYLASVVSGYTVGTNLIVGAVDARKKTTAPSYLLVREIGPAPRSTDGAEVVAKSIQLLSSAPTYQGSRTICDSFVATVLNKASIERTTYSILSITGDEVSYLGVDEKGLHQFVANLIVRIKRKGV